MHHMALSRVVSNTGKSIAITIAILGGKSIAIGYLLQYILQRSFAIVLYYFLQYDVA